MTRTARHRWYKRHQVRHAVSVRAFRWLAERKLIRDGPGSHFVLSSHVLQLARLPVELAGLRIAHLSDMHVGSLLTPEHLPAIVRAVNETSGKIVTYQGKLAITPYYSRSDGRTRSWGEVWYGGSKYPWLVSVPVPWDAAKGRTLWGHGVGMSASGALDAANDGWGYERILKYFYTGIDVTRIYK